MPELAEAEDARQKLDDVSRGCTITRVDFPSGEDPILFDGTETSAIEEALLGKRVASVGRKGKYFYLLMQSSPHLLLHFGMTGLSQVRGKVEARFYHGSSAKKVEHEPEVEWPPKHCKLVIFFSRPAGDGDPGSASPYFASQSDGDGGTVKVVTEEWAFCDSRRFGRVVLKDKHPLEEEPLRSMGRDPYTDMPTVNEVRESILKRRAPIKAVLMDQRGPFAGLGNYLCDEILFQAGLHPEHPSPLLDEAQLVTLVGMVRYVVVEAVKAKGREENFPIGWLFSRRWGKGKGGDDIVLADGTTAQMAWITVGGRTTAIVPSKQVLPVGIELKASPKRRIAADTEAPQTSPVTPKARKSAKTTPKTSPGHARSPVPSPSAEPVTPARDLRRSVRRVQVYSASSAGSTLTSAEVETTYE